MHRYCCTSNTVHPTFQVVVITGGSSGLGMTVAKQLYLRGANVILLGRSKSRAEPVLGKMIQQGIASSCRGTADFVHLDLASLESVRECARELKVKTHKIDILINNAGWYSDTCTLHSCYLDCLFSFQGSLLMTPRREPSTAST